MAPLGRGSARWASTRSFLVFSTSSRRAHFTRLRGHGRRVGRPDSQPCVPGQSWACAARPGAAGKRSTPARVIVRTSSRRSIAKAGAAGRRRSSARVTHPHRRPKPPAEASRPLTRPRVRWRTRAEQWAPWLCLQSAHGLRAEQPCARHSAQLQCRHRSTLS
eukprot:Amastigsp_a508398_29.p4 type:complete len:162 gc:universal Amastigsp_a508398_29:1320-1805(+)